VAAAAFGGTATGTTSAAVLDCADPPPPPPPLHAEARKTILSTTGVIWARRGKRRLFAIIRFDSIIILLKEADRKALTWAWSAHVLRFCQIRISDAAMPNEFRSATRSLIAEQAFAEEE
jgi:hypothetical protein